MRLPRSESCRDVSGSVLPRLMGGAVGPAMRRSGATLTGPHGATVSRYLLTRWRLSEADHGMDPDQAGKSEEENDPAREGVKESLRILDAQSLAHQPRGYDAPGIGQDRDRDDRHHERQSCPDSRKCQGGPGHRHGEKGDQGPNAAARFGDAQADLAQMDDVTVKEHRYSEEIEQPGCIPGSKSLQGECDRIEDDRRQGDHEEEEEEGERDDSEN